MGAVIASSASSVTLSGRPLARAPPPPPSPARPVPLSPLAPPRALRDPPTHHRLEIVAAEPREKGLHCERFRSPCQFAGTEDILSRDSNLRCDHDVPSGVQI